MKEKPLHERTFKELSFMKTPYCETPSDAKDQIKDEIHEWVLFKIRKCCPKKTPDSLGASPIRCESCENLMEMFNIKEIEIGEYEEDLEVKICPNCNGAGKIYRSIFKKVKSNEKKQF